MGPQTGTYYPNKPGSTLVDMKPYKIGDLAVSAKVDEKWVTGYAGEHQIFRKPVPAEGIHSYNDFYIWIGEQAKDCAVVTYGDSAVQADGHGYVYVDVTVARGSKAGNFGQRAAAAARKAANGMPVRRVSSGGCSTAEYEQHNFVYHF